MGCVVHVNAPVSVKIKEQFVTLDALWVVPAPVRRCQPVVRFLQQEVMANTVGGELEM
jgi:hypothetical protein